MSQDDSGRQAERTIADFGEQWTRYTDNEGYYGSLELFADICGPLLATSELAGKRVAEIGSGSGRIVDMLLAAGAGHVLAVEPSEGFETLRRNTARHGDRVECLRVTGEDLPRGRDLDYVVSIGVLHHIPEPGPVVAAAFAALRPGGRMLVWLYGHEGNEAYLGVVQPLRRVTTRLPAPALAALAHGLNAGLSVYMRLCRTLPLPLRDYLNNNLAKFSRDKRFLVVYDQLNPAFARYYRQDEARRLLEDAGFTDVRLHHRHGYSWTVIGTKPGRPNGGGGGDGGDGGG
jgi:SAM-dependent methyltransferase